MKSFATYYQRCQREEWANHYLNYMALKELIAKFGYRRSYILQSPSIHGHVHEEQTIQNIERVLDDYDAAFHASNGQVIQNQDSFAPPEYELMGRGGRGGGDKDDKDDDIRVNVNGAHESEIQPLDSDGCFTVGSGVSRESIHDQVARYEREEFCLALDREVENISKLYLSQLKLLKEQFTTLEHDTRNYDPSQINDANTQPHDNLELQQAHTWNHTNTVPATDCYYMGESTATIDTTATAKASNVKAPKLLLPKPRVPKRTTSIPITTHETSALEAAAAINTLESRYKELGDEILELFVFIGTNITALRQILIRYDSMIRGLDGPPLSKYYTLTRSTDGSVFEKLYHHSELDDMVEKFDGLSTSIEQALGSSAYTHALEKYKNDMAVDISKIEAKLLIAKQVAEKTMRGNKTLMDRVITSTRYYYTLGSLMNELVLSDAYLKSRGVTLKREIIFFAKWRKKSGRMSPSNTTQRRTSKARAQVDNLTSLMNPSLALVFVATYLYLMNHYIIEPSSATYMNALGGNDALAGVLIGMTPWSSIIAAFVYSSWSNTSFRQPMICSSIFLTVGSLLYAIADKHESITLAFMGRFITGLGGPCAMLMRYVADTVPKKDRTTITVFMTTVSAAGMSSGPGFAVLLDFLDLEINLPYFGRIYINGLTGPGYLMFVLWFIFLILVICLFEDGERKGLSELARSESMKPSGKEENYVPPLSPNNSIISTNSVTSNDSSSFDEEIDIMPTRTEEDFLAINQEEIESKNKPIQLINQATLICMAMKFMGKICLEVLTCSDSIITRNRYGWSIKNVGTLGFINGCLTVPISIGVGYLTQIYTDWNLLMSLQCVALLGVVLMIDVTDVAENFGYVQDGGDDDGMYGYNHYSLLSVGPWRYVAGQMIQFCGYHASQSIVMSMLSKVVPLALAKGTFNSGFIASILTSTSRASGDFLITAMGFVSIRYLLNLLAIPCLVVTLLSIRASYVYRHKLSV